MIIIGIAGGTGSGKTVLASKLLGRIGNDCAAAIPHDAYYKDLTHLSEAERAAANFDHPDSLETDLLITHLDQLRAGNAIGCPEYDFAHHTRLPSARSIPPSNIIIIVEGILVLSSEDLRSRCDVKLFVDTSADIRLSRRLQRDVAERGRSVESVLRQWQETAQPMHERFVEPTRLFADLIVSGEKDIEVAVSMIADAVGGLEGQA